MKTFKEFKTNPPLKQGVLDKSGTPCAVILNHRPSPDIAADVDKVSCNTIKESAKEKVDEEWPHQNDNDHIGEESTYISKFLSRKQSHSDHHDPANIDAGGNVSRKHWDRSARWRAYTTNSTHLNKTLYKHHIEGTAPPRMIQSGHDKNDNMQIHDTHALDDAIGHHKLPTDLHVYSGVHFHPGEVAAQHPEGHIHLPAYTSTSIDKHTASMFAIQNAGSHSSGTNRTHHIIHIHLKKGQAGAHVFEHSSYSDEHEHILPRNTTIKIHPEPTITKNFGKKIHVWHAHVVDKE